MEDLKSHACVLRWAAQNTAHNLTFIPEDRLDWKPEPGAKSALEIVGEVTAAMQMMLPVFTGGVWAPRPFPRPNGLQHAQEMVREEAERYAAALEAAGPELERVTPVAGQEVWAARAVLFPVIDMIHHHGQIAYIQSLLGDVEPHFALDALRVAFGPP